MERRRYFDCIAGTCISESRRRSEGWRKHDQSDYLCPCWTVSRFVAVTASRVLLAQQVVDKMVATVNAGVRTDLITYSDLLWQLALQPNTLLDNPTSEDLNRALRF